MGIYIVTYDLNKEVKRPNVLAEIKKREWMKLSESSYTIKTAETPHAVYNSVKPLLDDNDNLYVISLCQPHTGFGPKDVNDWLNKNLP